MDLQPNRFGPFGEFTFMMDGLTDISVIIKSGKSEWKFRAHKIVLANASAYFSELFENKNINEIILDNVTPSTAYILFIYIYYGDFQAENWIDVNDLIPAAYMYRMNNLVEKCAKFLEDVITPYNVCYIYENTVAYFLPVLQQKCLKLISDFGFKIIRSQVFKMLKEEIVINIIASPQLNIDSELMILKSLFRWAQLECCRKNLDVNEVNIINVIKPFLMHICIKDIPDDEKNLFPSWFIECIKPNDCTRIKFHVPESLIKYSYNLEFEIDYKNVDFIQENLVCLRFAVDLPIYMIGVHFTYVCKDSSPLHLKVIKENNPSEVLIEQTSQETLISSVEAYNNTWRTTKVILEKPVYLKPTNVYHIQAIEHDVLEIMQVTCTQLLKPQLYTPVGNLNIYVYESRTWGITNILFL